MNYLTIAEKFQELGGPITEPALVGASRAIIFFQEDLDRDLGGDLGRLPRPDYEHQIWRDDQTYWIARPDRNGNHGFRPKELAKMERIR